MGAGWLLSGQPGLVGLQTILCNWAGPLAMFPAWAWLHAGLCCWVGGRLGSKIVQCHCSGFLVIWGQRLCSKVGQGCWLGFLPRQIIEYIAGDPNLAELLTKFPCQAEPPAEPCRWAGSWNHCSGTAASRTIVYQNLSAGYSKPCPLLYLQLIPSVPLLLELCCSGRRPMQSKWNHSSCPSNTVLLSACSPGGCFSLGFSQLSFSC